MDDYISIHQHGGSPHAFWTSCEQSSVRRMLVSGNMMHSKTSSLDLLLKTKGCQDKPTFGSTKMLLVSVRRHLTKRHAVRPCVKVRISSSCGASTWAMLHDSHGSFD